MTAQDWNSRYAAAQQWSDEPNALAASILVNVPPGRALDLEAGEGRMALWLAACGWRVTALDFSVVGLERGKARATELGVDVDWQVADATIVELGQQLCDLVLVLYLHLPRTQLPGVLSRAAASVVPGGRLLVLGHDQDNLEHGVAVLRTGNCCTTRPCCEPVPKGSTASGWSRWSGRSASAPRWTRSWWPGGADVGLLIRDRRNSDRIPRRFGDPEVTDCSVATPQVHRCAAGTPRMTCSTCRPHPDHVVLPHVRHVA